MSGYAERDRANRLQTAIEHVEQAQAYLAKLREQLGEVDPGVKVQMDQAYDLVGNGAVDVRLMLEDGERSLIGVQWK